MATNPTRDEDPGLAPAAVLKQLVAVAVQLQALTKTLEHLRARIEGGANNQGIRIAVLAAILDATLFLSSLVKLEIAVEADGEE